MTLSLLKAAIARLGFRRGAFSLKRYGITLRRKAWTAGRADPTAVTQWTLKVGRWFEVEMLASWGVETRTKLWRKRFWSYDARWAKWLFGVFENRYDREQERVAHAWLVATNGEYDRDPMGELSDYI